MCAFYLIFQHMKGSSHDNRPIHIAVKCAATSMAVLAGILGCLRNGTGAHWIILAGLAACTVADGVLCRHFLAGGAIFVLGHILYIVAFCIIHPPTWFCILLFIALMGASIVIFTRFRSRIGDRYPFFLAYAAVLSIMVSLSAVQYPLFFAGALLFVFSDALLGYMIVNGSSTKLDYISLGAYYLGQFLLGTAVYLS